MIYLRIIVFLFLFVSAIFVPPLFVLAFFVLAVSFFPKFFEGILIGVVMDSFYFSPVLFSKFGLGFFTINFIVAFLLTNFIKNLVQGRNFPAKIAVALPGFAYFYLLLFLFY